MNSHKTLPIQQRKVDIYNLMLLKPKATAFKNNDFLPTADEILANISNKKDRLIQNFYGFVNKISIQKDKSCF